jgi:hypothetical protein
MKRSTALLSALLLSSAIAFGAPATNDLTGNWKGAIEVGQVKLRLLFKISRTPAGVLTAKLDSLDQGARDIPVETVVTKDNTVRMEVKSVQGVYEGAFDPAGKKIIGTWQQGPQSLPLTLERNPGTSRSCRARETLPRGPGGQQAGRAEACRGLEWHPGGWGGQLPPEAQYSEDACRRGDGHNRERGPKRPGNPPQRDHLQGRRDPL